MKRKFRIGQILKSRFSDLTVKIVGYKGDKFRAVVLTEDPKRKNGSHTFSLLTLRKKFEPYDPSSDKTDERK